MEKIDGIKIVQVDGLNRGGNGASGSGSGGGSGNLAEQAVSAALAYRAQQPILDALLSEIGMKGGDLNGMVDAVRQEIAPAQMCGGAESKPGSPSGPLAS
jgi:uncharacterized membrane protein YqiK